MDRDEMYNRYRESSIDISFQLLVNFGQRVSEENIFFYKLTNQKQELPMAAMVVDRSGRNTQSLLRTFRRCFLPSFDSISQAVSEEKIHM